MPKALKPRRPASRPSVHMVYDSPPEENLEAMNRKLAKHNMIFVAFVTPRWKGKGVVTQNNFKKPVSRDWLTIADTIVFAAGGGCQ